jgi:hypothetical protein
MKCEMPGCRRELDPDDTYETDVGGTYRKVCKKCYQKAIGGEQSEKEVVGTQSLQLAF